MDEYASIRFILFCHRAMALPSVIVRTETIPIIYAQSKVVALFQMWSMSIISCDSPVIKNRIIRAKPAAFETTDSSAVVGIGAPSYTSGVQKWNGTAEILYAMPANISMIDVASASSLPVDSIESCWLISVRSNDPVSPNSKDIPNIITPDATEPYITYLRDASDERHTSFV